MKDSPTGRCIAESLEAVVNIFDATVVHGLVGNEILGYRDLMQGRTPVVLNP